MFHRIGTRRYFPSSREVVNVFHRVRRSSMLSAGFGIVFFQMSSEFVTIFHRVARSSLFSNEFGDRNVLIDFRDFHDFPLSSKNRHCFPVESGNRQFPIHLDNCHNFPSSRVIVSVFHPIRESTLILIEQRNCQFSIELGTRHCFMSSRSSTLLSIESRNRHCFLRVWNLSLSTQSGTCHCFYRVYNLSQLPPTLRLVFIGRLANVFRGRQINLKNEYFSNVRNNSKRKISVTSKDLSICKWFTSFRQTRPTPNNIVHHGNNFFTIKTS